MKSIIRKELQLILKERGSFFWLIFMPMAIIFIYSSLLKDPESSITQMVPNYTVMFVFFIILTMVRSFFRERESGMLSRLRSTPMKPISYLLGMWISSIIAVIIQCAVLFDFGHMVYKMSFGDIYAVIPLILALSVCVTGIGLAVSFIVSSENQGVAFTEIFALGGSAIGGIWVSYDMLPKFAQKISCFTPQYWAQNGLIDVMAKGGHIGNVWLNIIILLAFGITGLIVALFRFKGFIMNI